MDLDTSIDLETLQTDVAVVIGFIAGNKVLSNTLLWKDSARLCISLAADRLSINALSFGFILTPLPALSSSSYMVD